jgi:hypothetical protein
MRHSIEGVPEILVAAASGGELASNAGVNQSVSLAGWPLGGIKTRGSSIPQVRSQPMPERPQESYSITHDCSERSGCSGTRGSGT